MQDDDWAGVGFGGSILAIVSGVVVGIWLYVIVGTVCIALLLAIEAAEWHQFPRFTLRSQSRRARRRSSRG